MNDHRPIDAISSSAPHLHIIDDAHEFLHELDREPSVFEAVNGESPSGLFVSVL